MFDKLTPGVPFFGGETRGVQGFALARHPSLSAAIFKLSESKRRLKILEVGSYAGFSTLTWAQSVEEFCPNGADILCVDAWQAYDEIPGIDMEKIFELFQHNISTAQSERVSISYMRGRTDNILTALLTQSFDVVYIDASHRYEDVVADLGAAVMLTAEGGFVCGDDLELQLSEIDPATDWRKISAVLYTDPKTGKQFHLGVTLAVADVLGAVSNYWGFYIMQKRSGSFEKVDLRGSRIIMPKHFPPEMQADLARNVGG